MKRLLVVANDFPYPPTHGAAVDIWNRILILREMDYRVDLLVSIREQPDPASLQVVSEQVDNLWMIPRRRGIVPLMSLTPFQVNSRSTLKGAQVSGSFDAIILEADYVASFLDHPATRDSKLILRIHNEQVGYFKDLADGAADWRKKLYYLSESFKFRFFSQRVIRRCDLLWFISDSEREDHVRRHPADARKSFFLPTHVNPADMRPFHKGGKNALFVGSLTISHNADSIVWYIENVHPLLAGTPGYAFKAAGRTGGQPIPVLTDLVAKTENASLEKDPELLDDLYEQAGVFVNPVIRGAGIKIKVVQAIQAGLPVVTTSMGIEGTGFQDAVHVLVGDSPAAFADCVRRILTQPELAESLVRNAQEFVRQRYDMKANMQKTLSEVLQKVR